ncbi:MAG: HEAT repeat domain-containing protein [Pseudomonadota bacterium]
MDPAIRKNLSLDIDQLMVRGDQAPEALFESIVEKVEKHPEEATTILLEKASTSNIDAKRLSLCMLLLGYTKSPRAGKFLVNLLEKTESERQRYYILSTLAQLQYKPALPKMEEILKKDPETYYWESIFVFGKMGDISVPFLIQRINDKNRNVRKNAIMLLGWWLIAPEAVGPLREQYWQENDLETKQMILSALEGITPDIHEIQEFSEVILAKEKEETLLQFAKETIKNIDKIKSYLRSFRDKKKANRLLFDDEYEKLYNSYGRVGDYEVLSMTSIPQDEDKLRQLKQRILQRGSDEAFYDYQKVNEIIIFNRLMTNS